MAGHRSESDRGDEALAHEMSRRVVYSLLLPVVRLAARFHIPVKELGDLVQMAYYHETRRDGLKMREAAGLLGVSMRKVVLLSKRLKENFMRSRDEMELTRRIEFILWAQPVSIPRLCQALSEDDPDEVATVVAKLLEDGRVVKLEGRTTRYELQLSQVRLAHDTWLAKIDGLNNLLGSLADTVFARFFRSERHAFARTISLRIRREDLAQLQELYDESIWPKLVQLDEKAKDEDDPTVMDVSIFWTPNEYIKQDE